ncbi:MAG: BRO family protein [Betaproteobacteria bacterium]|nr:BRO family protein [Betaproteobacteria bacterium]
MPNIIPFRFESRALRVQVDDAGQPWFNTNDVCAALELANPRDAITKHVDSDDVAKRDIIDRLGRVQLASVVNESGLYALILGSTKDAAKRFKRWVTHDVLPAIRKTGSYSAPGKEEDRAARQKTMRVVDGRVRGVCVPIHSA